MTNTDLLQALYDDMQNMKQDMQNMKQDMSDVKQDVKDVKQGLLDMDQRVSNVEYEVKKINLVLENETNRNIRIVAEAHLDLSRKLDECILLSSEVKARQEIQDLYINRHESLLKAKAI
ncbi:MAG: hypothetical protein NC314_08275 [Roseburia sp.]|nr:hypothetical protein [Ruminococcus sp.]MCM1155700.1 hypothetical protein [Roseburia sp.]MCM1242821.1 hypothetical protein [Roseburia sp.]